MAKIFLCVAVLCFVNIAAASAPTAHLTALPKLLYPELRSEAGGVRNIQEIPLNAYEYQIIPNDQFAVGEYYDTNSLSLWTLITDPITAVTIVVSQALSVMKWVLYNGSMVILGMALVLGFCAFTPYCTLTIETPLFRTKRALDHATLNNPYFDNIENHFNDAFHKYHEMQNA